MVKDYLDHQEALINSLEGARPLSFPGQELHPARRGRERNQGVVGEIIPPAEPQGTLKAVFS